MLSQQDNALLCEVEPGTPMNTALARYWFPALPAHMVAQHGCDPVRARLLGRDYVINRDHEGQLAILDEKCCHRGASLCLARNEVGGLRCIYHGWKFAVDGRLVETPNAKGDYAQRYRQPAGKARAAANVIWVYLGPAAAEPPFPQLPFLDLPDAHVVVQEVFIDANFVQVMEGLVDSSHLGFLHRDSITASLKDQQTGDDATYRQMLEDLSPRVEVEETGFGFHYAALREIVSQGKSVTSARITAFALPFFDFTPNNTTMMATVPVDTHRTLLFEFNWDWDAPIGPELRDKILAFHGIGNDVLDRLGLSRATYAGLGAAGQLAGFIQNRAAMRSGDSFTGLPNFLPEDVAVCLSMGSMTDRSRENLVPADQAVVRLRRVLLQAARGEAALAEPGWVPRALQGELAAGEDWNTLPQRRSEWRKSFGKFSSTKK